METQRSYQKANRFSPIVSIIAISAICLFFTQAGMAATGTVNYSTVYQQLEGFGAAIYVESETLVDRSYKEAFYDFAFRDLGLDILRIRNTYSVDSSFITAAGSIVREANERAVAMGRPIPKIELVPWSPPASCSSGA